LQLDKIKAETGVQLRQTQGDPPIRRSLPKWWIDL